MLEGFTPWPKEFADRYRERGYWQGRTLGSLLRDRAEATPDAVAVVDGQRRWTYRELDLRADRLAAGLHGLGLTPGDRVLVHLSNSAEFLELSFALFRLGAVPVMALPAHREAEIAHLLALSEAVAYVVPDTHLGFDHRQLARSVREKAPSLRHILVAGDAEEFTSLASIPATPRPLPEPDPSDVAVLLLSGGTTGAPKLIPRTHDDYLYNASASAEVTGLTADSRYLAALPVAHNFPLACPGILGTLHAGGTVVMCPTPSPDTAFPLIARERVTVTALVPSLALLWLEAAEWAEDDLSSLELLQVGGSRLKAETARRVAPELGCRLQQVFGMAEGLLCHTRLDDPEHLVIDSQGRPLCTDDEIRIVDPGDRDVPHGEVGELLVRGPYTLRGYYRADDHNARAFTADGFYRSGDLVRRLPTGHLVVEGRIKDVINRGGEKVPVEEVENHLLAHPAVHDAALIGLPDEHLGERSCACLISRGTPPTRTDLTAHLTARGLAAYKLPDEVRVLKSFPRTALGKVDKAALARQVSA
ncbi:(2,3-dihydroxybenzoyl)adenylate synthase [Streptomyces noursei]|uniref:(2,3-dihydroxybenzoyl)adenylate synthase n=1 Tax=Streptomyces noursei TaxID=1971 RepID=UPI00167BA6D7|nr:AMP-binding protein [Streptomyces noursei]MCZ1014169.1 AMP-binding protein [Streptomyces noursei]GGX23900.1 2,3-dihydroxybenzoate-AMP ligase [Streptomyces noursei]